ncbi:hypothetical protein DXQ21_00210 [Listeria monocytogenes]|nr:hypothetical protein [Listeria monocytogenes]
MAIYKLKALETHKTVDIWVNSSAHVTVKAIDAEDAREKALVLLGNPQEQYKWIIVIEEVQDED